MSNKKAVCQACGGTVLFLCCRISRLQLLEFQYYSMVDKMAVLEALTMQQLLVSTPVSFPFHLTVVSFLH